MKMAGDVGSLWRGMIKSIVGIDDGREGRREESRLANYRKRVFLLVEKET